MMTSMGGNRARGSWEQTQGQTQSQTQHKQRPQATAEQIRLAQMISDHNDADFEEKVKQVRCSPEGVEPCLLHTAVFLDSWEMVGKKKGVSGQKEISQAETCEEGKENREKGAEKDPARRRGGAPRRSRGTSRGRDFRSQENGLDGGKAAVTGRGAERGRRGRGRGRGAVDYAEPAQTEDSYGGGSTWNNTGSAELDEGSRLEYPGGEGTNYPPKFDSAPGAWRSATEEWGTEDWNEDLSETKIFTASSVASVPLPQENVTITKGQRIDLAVLLGKTPPSSSSETENAPMEPPHPPSLSQSLVFSNSKQGAPLSQSSSSAPYSQHSMGSMLSKGFGDVDPKGGSTGTTGSQFLEQYKTAQALAQLAAQHSQSGATSTAPSSWDTGSGPLGQFDMKAPAESGIHSPFTKRQPYQAATSASSMLDVFLQDKGLPASSSSLPQHSSSSPHSVPSPALSKMGSMTSAGHQVSPGSSEVQGSSPLPLQQHKLKQQKKKTSLTTKIPVMAVEMPGSADISGLNLQFGALQFGSEPVLQEYESSPATTTPSNQGQNSLYTAPSSDSTSALSGSNQMDIYDQRAPPPRRYPPSVSSSPQKDMQPKNGFSSMQAAQSVEAAAGPAAAVKSSDSVAQTCVSGMGSLADGGPASSLLTTSNQASLGVLGHAEDLPPSSISSQQNRWEAAAAFRFPRADVTSLSLQHPDADSTLHSSFPPVPAVPSSSVPSSSSSVAAAQVSLGVPQGSSVGPATVSAPSGLGPVSGLAMGLGAASMGAPAAVPASVLVSTASSSIPSSVTSSSTRSSAASSGKAPPNLPPGVPPLLPNPYIMAPGLLHAYPVSLRPPDYYSIPFPTPTTALTGRDGSLTSNHYSGELAKFGRGDASSPAPATTLAQTQQSQTQTHHTTQQPFLNPGLPPGYSYPSLPYYTGMPGLPNTFQYGPAVFPVAPTSSKQHGVNVGVNASATPFQQASGYGSHGYSTGVSVTSSNTGVPDISGSVYTKTQSFEKQGFHAGTPAASFSLPSALGSGGPINPPAAAGYAPAPFMHILAPHQQPHSQILHHHLQQDGQSGSGQRSQNASLQQKSQINKSAYNSYSWGAN
uniref:Ubiquitin associated protein 2-like n=1 Tax=Oryzias melastigma TaxID=30732 RepID=A0A3B3BI99_ORYME